MAIKTGIEGKPWYYALGVGLAVGVVLLGVVFFFLLRPMREQIAGQEVQLGELQNRIQEAQAAERDLPKFREEVRRLELELDKLLRILPARRNTPDLLRRIRSLAEQGNFTLKRFTPAQLADKDFYSEWPIQLAVDGTYHNLALFFDKIGRFSRIINIEDLQISSHPQQAQLAAASEGGHTIAAEFKAKTFVYKEPEPVPPAGPAAGSPAAAAMATPPGG
ncbi:MAG TPA: type 4a pilus biogenesis protein PilO [Thermoanaerobaculia bacterium]|nr:type 4a pilus biogenesis protein PilO [Thermoanaerobaculia bacterium]